LFCKNRTRGSAAIRFTFDGLCRPGVGFVWYVSRPRYWLCFAKIAGRFAAGPGGFSERARETTKPLLCSACPTLGLFCNFRAAGRRRGLLPFRPGRRYRRKRFASTLGSFGLPPRGAGCVPVHTSSRLYLLSIVTTRRRPDLPGFGRSHLRKRNLFSRKGREFIPGRWNPGCRRFHRFVGYGR
jgi:hypothetical protein